MVKPINPEEMKLSTEAAASLKQETAGGQGDPLSRRLAEAIIENNENMRKQNELIAAFTEALSDSAKKAAAASEQAENATHVVESIAFATLETVKDATATAVTKAIPKQITEFFTAGQEQMIAAGITASGKVEKAAEEAARSIQRSREATDKQEERAKAEHFLFALGGIGKMIFTIAFVGTVVLVLFAGWRCLPIVTGEAQITYTEAYQSGLDETNIELIKIRNELEAYKEAYPEGLAEQRLHNLNEKNDKDVSDYQGNRGEG